MDITSFKRYNDTFGHAVGDQIIERVARILADQIRSDDFLAVERGIEARDLHARFGGDEFCFLIPQLPGCVEATEIAERFRQAVSAYDWGTEDERLADNPVGVDVGVVCLRMGPVADRRGVARQLAAELIQRADVLMYEAKTRRSERVHACAVAVENGVLVDIASPGEANGRPASVVVGICPPVSPNARITSYTMWLRAAWCRCDSVRCRPVNNSAFVVGVAQR